MTNIYKQGVLFLILMLIISCNKFVVVNPPITQLTNSTVYSADGSAAAVLTGIYIDMNQGGLATGTGSLSLLCGLSADELLNYSSNPSQSEFFLNALKSDNSSVQSIWAECYKYIYTTNATLEGLATSNGVNAALKQQLIGESQFIRAFCYFYLVNLWGNVPLVTSTVYQNNAIVSRSSKEDVYQQILADLKNAQNILSNNYLAPDGTTTNERVRPNRVAATAFLARVYLYMGDWKNAEAEADSVISNSSNYSLDSLNNVFLANSTEALWQLQSLNNGFNTLDGYTFILTNGPNQYLNTVSISSTLLDSFEIGDNRKTNWIAIDSSTGQKYYYPFKYKIGSYGAPISEYLMVFRLGEQYLIRAEAEVELNDLADATTDLNIIRNRAGLNNTTAMTQSDLLAAIFHERQVELFTEWGNRWLDLIRTGNVNTVMGSPGNICRTKGGSWSPNGQLYPIPLLDITSDPNLIQNPGYN